MMDFYTAEKKLELVRAKYELSKYSAEFFMKIYHTEEQYYDLLSRLETIMVLDCDFILLGNHMNKYREIINLGRFKYHTKGEIRNYENLTLTTLNSQEQTKEEFRKKYLMEQLKVRLHLGRKARERMLAEKGVEKIDNSVCFFSEFDYTYLGVLNQLKRKMEITSTEPALKYLSSISYLLKNAEEIFWQDEGYCDATLSIIDAYDCNNLIPDDYSVKKLKRKLNRMKKKR